MELKNMQKMMEENKEEKMVAKDKNAKKDGQAKSKLRKWIVVAFLLIAIVVGYVNYRGEYLETLELGNQYLSVFWQNLNTTFITFGVNFLILFLLIYFTNRGIQKGLKPFFDEDKKEIVKIPNKSIAFVVAIIVSFFTSNSILEKLLLCINSTEFSIADPILGYDIGYYIFIHPFIQYMLYYALGIMVGLTIYIVAYYIIAFNFYFDGVSRETLKKSNLIKQICNKIIIIAILIGTLMFVETNNVGLQKFLTLEDSGSYVLWGAGLSEVTIKMWGYRVLSVIIIASVVVAVRAFKKNNTARVIKSLLIVPAYLILMLLALVGFEAIFERPNELDKQQPYIKANIEATKQAYGIDIDEINLEENQTITTQIISENETVVNNVALVDENTVLQDLNALQTNKGYYTYRTTKISGYMVDGKKQLVYVSPREITNSNGTYNNKTYEYTHGYGVVLTSASSVDEKGNLVHLQKDFENSSNNVVTISQPRIYFGLETNETVVTNSKGKTEFDYPIASSTKAENAQNVYEGNAGLKLNFLDRLILSIKKGDLNLAFSGSESKILINRNIIERAQTLMPYIMYDENPYLVTTAEGKLVWVLDGYTTSNYYPYSQKIVLEKGNVLNKTQINYIRNSVKVLVDAYDGTIKYYITDRNDPIIMAYQKMYKDLFVDKDKIIPEDISSQLIYPEYLYSIQAEIIERYHNIQTDVLYRGDDIWETATHNAGKILTKKGTKIEPYYTMVKTVDSNQEIIGLVLPYTPYGKQNLTSYLVGTCKNGAQKLTLYKYPSDSNILGPMQLDTQLEQDEGISSEIASLNVAGTKITKNMLVIPINNCLLYVEPIYQQYINEENSTQILKKVVVASGNKVAIGNNLKEALNNLVSQYAVDIEIENTDSIEGLIAAIIKANNNLKDSNSNNSWEMIGKDMARLQELITKLEKLQEETTKKDDLEDENNQSNNEVINNQVNNMVSNEIQ